MFVGNTGTGKTANIMSKLNRMDPESMMYTTINMNSFSDAPSLQVSDHSWDFLVWGDAALSARSESVGCLWKHVSAHTHYILCTGKCCCGKLAVSTMKQQDRLCIAHAGHDGAAPGEEEWCEIRATWLTQVRSTAISLE